MSTSQETAAPAARRRGPRDFVLDRPMAVKLVSLATLGVILAGVVGLVGQQSINAVARAGRNTATVTAPRQALALNITRDWLRWRRFALEEALASRPQEVAAIRSKAAGQFTALTGGIQQLRRGATPQEAVLLDRIARNTAAAQQAYRTYVEPLKTGNGFTPDVIRQVDSAYRTKVSPPADVVRDDVDRLTEIEKSLMAADVRRADAERRSATIEIWAVTLLGGLLLTAAGWWLARAMSASVARVRDALRALSDGDLTARAHVDSQDEIGHMAAALETAQASLRAAISQISDTSAMLSGSAEELSTVAVQVSNNTTETSQQATDLAGAANQVSGNVQTVAAGTEQMATSIQEISSSSVRAAEVAATAVAEASSATEIVGRLGESSNEIGNVIKVITNIAEQTNLLALNATIEAARAGEVGKGFAVVAEEVKQLAQETARATEDISRRVEAIQGDTGDAVAAIGRISQVIEEINNYQTTIASAVEEQTATTSEMARNISQVAEGSSRIAGTIDAVAHAADDSATGIKEAQSAAGELARLSGTLRELAGRFRS